MRFFSKGLLRAAVILFLVVPAFSQGYYFPYYGKNKVLYENFRWKSYESEHFRILYYADDVKTLQAIARMAESAYQKISRTLKHQLSDRVPLIYYDTFTDFEQTNLFDVSEGVLGVAEPVLHRIGVYGDLAPDELQTIIEHELAHVFQFDILWGKQGAALYSLAQPPAWTFEGLSEYVTEKRTAWSALILRDAVLNDRIPELTEAGEFSTRYPMPRDPAYDFGHAIYEFIESKFGQNGIRELWYSLKNYPLIGKRDPIKKIFNMKVREFNQSFKKYLRERHKDFFLRENPEDYSIALGPEFPMNPYYFSFSNALSPSGDIVATITYSIRDEDLDIVLISTKDGSVIKNITKGYTGKYEYIKFDVDMSKGRSLAWAPDGNAIAFFGRDGQKYSLFIIDPFRGDTKQRVKIEQNQPSSPCFSPDGKFVLFTAFHGGVHDIFRLDLITGEVRNLTADDLFEKAPSFSPDGKLIAYSIRLDGVDNLFLSPVDDLKEKTQLTFGRGDTIAPWFAPDGKHLFFSGDLRGAYNIFSLNIETNAIKRYTDVRTGNFFPCPMPDEPRKIVFSSFNKGAFQIFKAELPEAAEEPAAPARVESAEALKRFDPVIAFDINEKEIKPYRGIGSLYITSRPPVDALISTDGSVYGGSSLAFSDLLGDHNFNIMAYQAQAFRSYFFSYLNQKRRLQFMTSLFEYTVFYYPPYVYYDPSLYFSSYFSYKDAIATRKISGVDLSAYYPFSKTHRLEGNFGFYQYEEDFLDPFSLGDYSPDSFAYFWNGNVLTASLSLVGETTRFRYYGPASGSTYRLSLTQALPVSNAFLRNTTVELDLRRYLYLGADALFALRFKGFASRGKNPYLFYFGGNNEVRSAYYYNIIANEGWYANAEFRFPLFTSTPTILGQFGPVRGVLFFDIARAKMKGYPAEFRRFTSLFLYERFDATGSFGYGLQFFFLGLPVHLEFVKQLDFPDISRPYDFQASGKFETKFWIGFDF